MSSVNVLITGTKAGIGHGLLKAYAARPNTNVIAAIRDAPDSSKANAMVASIETAPNSTIMPVQYDASSPDSAIEMVEYIRERITHLDLVVASAALINHWGPAATVTAKELSDHVTTNTFGPIFLYQATRDLLLAAKTPKFFYISTVAASINSVHEVPFPVLAYGLSKAAGNYFVRKTNEEEERLMLAAVHPGWVQTEKGNDVAVRYGQKEAPLTIAKCVEGLVGIFDMATKEEMGGTFQAVEGGVVPW